MTCETTRKDQYGRWLAHCDVAGVSVANWLAGHGWAVPYRDCKCEEVKALSKEAESQNAGIWGGAVRYALGVAECELRRMSALRHKRTFSEVKYDRFIVNFSR